MPKHPLAEVLGFPPDNLSERANNYRENRLCPFNNRVPSCTKDKANDPLGVCTIRDGDSLAITCPIRFREDWLVARDVASFFFPKGTRWTTLTEVQLKDKHGRQAGNIDIVLVSYDEKGRITDFGALEIQAVYISGNVRRPFEYYMEDPANRHDMDWAGKPNYPRADYLSSSRKRLVPQLIYKGGILNSWGKKIGVALHRDFLQTLPHMEEVEPRKAEVAWLVYDLSHNPEANVFNLTNVSTIHTLFTATLDHIMTSEAGPIEEFVQDLQQRLDETLQEPNPPDAPTLDELL